MKHSIFSKMLVAMSMMMTSALVFVSCDGDDKIEKTDPREIKLLVCEHVLDVSADYLDFYDITVTYKIGEGGGITEEVTFDTYIYTFNFDAAMMEIPDKITGVVTATPKGILPEYDQEKVYNLGFSNEFVVKSTCNNGDTSEFPVNMRGSNLPIAGSKIQSLLDKGARTLASFEYTR